MPAMTALAAFGAVRGAGDEADVAVRLAARAVVAADGQQPGELALRAGVGLHADRGVAGDLGQRGAQLVDQLPVAAGLLDRGERVQVGELRPGDRAISTAEFSFIVQEPSGIIVRSSARSLSDSERR
jgi:hypothetical protein